LPHTRSFALISPDKKKGRKNIQKTKNKINQDNQTKKQIQHFQVSIIQNNESRARKHVEKTEHTDLVFISCQIGKCLVPM
jgi:hypothetical protein